MAARRRSCIPAAALARAPLLLGASVHALSALLLLGLLRLEDLTVPLLDVLPGNVARLHVVEIVAQVVT